MNRYLFILAFLLGRAAWAIDGIYLGGELGYVNLSGNTSIYSNALGFDVDLGIKTNPILDINFQFGYSSHSGGAGLTLYHPTASANLHVYQMNDFDLSLGLGPGFYFFKTGAITESDFGLNFGVAGDVVVEEAVHVGIGWQWHKVFGGTIGDNFWDLTMRVGYFFSI